MGGENRYEGIQGDGKSIGELSLNIENRTCVHMLENSVCTFCLKAATIFPGRRTIHSSLCMPASDDASGYVACTHTSP